MCLKVVTPINISDGIVLGAKDYLYDSRRQKVFFLNLHQWHMFIYKHMLLEKYESYLANFRDKQSLLEWLQMQGYDIDDVRTVITSEAQATVNLMDNEKKKTLNDINRHIQQPEGSLYVPGSSIKGVFRTAILYSLLQKRQDIKSKYYLRLEVENRMGVLAGVTGVLGNNGVSISQVLQKASDTDSAELVVITDTVRERHIRDALTILSNMSMVHKIASVIRVY